MPGAAIFEIETPWVEADLPRLRYEQTADVSIITCFGYAMRRLRRFGHADWRLDEAPIGAQIDAPTIGVVATNPQSGDPDYVEQPYSYAVTAINAAGQESPASATSTVNNDLALKGDFNTITVSVAVDGAVEYRVYAVRSGVYGFVGRIVDGLSFKDDNILADFSNGPPSATDPFADGEHPSVCALHEGRLFVGRTPTRPSAIFGSKIDDLFNFDKSSPLQATDSIALAIRGKRVNAIEHLVGLGDALIVMTSDSVASLIPAGDGFLSPTSIRRRFESYQGVGKARPETVVDVLMYATGRANEIRTLNYSFEKDGYRGNNISVFATHFFSGFTITHMCWAEVPSGILWCLRNDGKLLALTWQAEQDVWGWTLCETDGAVESICVVSEDGNDILYATVRRTIDGETRRYIERLTVPHWIDENWTAVEDAVVMDSAVTYKGETAVTQLRRLDWLEGKDVAVLADGFVITGRSVVDGALTPPLDTPANTISVGLPYRSVLRTLPIVAQVQGSGSTKGRSQLASNLTVEVLNTRGILYGLGLEREPGQLYEIEFPDATNSFPVPMFSGVWTTDDLPTGDWSDGAQVTVAQHAPLPMVLLGVHIDVEMGG